MIGQYENAEGKLVEVFKVNDKYTVFVDGKLTQKDLDPDSFVRYACWVMGSMSFKLVKAERTR